MTAAHGLDAKTIAMLNNWLAMHNGDVESLARWMRDSLRIAGIKDCRRLIAEAVAAQ